MKIGNPLFEVIQVGEFILLFYYSSNEQTFGFVLFAFYMKFSLVKALNVYTKLSNVMTVLLASNNC